MAAFLFSIGVVAALAGLVTIGFGVRIYEFGPLGDALIISGAVVVVGGLIIVGLGAAVRELRRVGQLLERAGPRPGRPVETDAAIRVPARGAMPARPPPAGVPRRPAEQRPPPIPMPERPAPEPERFRPGGFPGPRGSGEPPVVDEGDLVPLSPAGLGRTMRPPPALSEDDGTLEPRFDPPAPAASPHPVPRFDSPRPQEAERPKRNLFDPTWSSPAASRREAPERTPPEPGPAPPSHIDEPVASEPEEPGPTPAERDQPQPAPVSILKSGVIDGMAYTLYTDGSIEAQLPSGIMRFESIDELRLHLEKNG
jgi:hypothetical protein